MLFLMWFDDSPKLTLAQKIAEACAAFQERNGVAPTLALVCPGDVTAPLADALVTIRPATNIRPNTVWVGREE